MHLRTTALLMICAPAAFAAQPTVDLMEIISKEALQSTIQQAMEKIGKDDAAGGSSLLHAAIGSAIFNSLEIDQRHALLTLAGMLDYELKDFNHAKAYLSQACNLPNPTIDDWRTLLDAAYASDDMPTAIIALTRVARGWPKEVSSISDRAIFHVVAAARKQPSADSDYLELLTALFAAHWMLEGNVEPSFVWRDYTQLLLERGRLREAKEAALRVTLPSALISMRVDNRFAAIVRSEPRRFDIDNAVEADIAQLRANMLNSPRVLQNVVELSYALLKSGRNAEVLELTESAMRRAGDRSGGKAAYSDSSDALVWVLNNRAIALGRLGRMDEKIEQLVRAARRPEKGELNVSQAINLAELYCDLERPKDALFAIVDVEDTSPYGRMQLEAVRYCAALQLNDRTVADAALAYLSEHRSDAIGTYQDMLLEGGDLGAAAALLIDRLQDPRLRSDVLLSIQSYADSPALPHAMKNRERFIALLERDDVKSAVSKVGHIEHFNLVQAGD